MDEVRARLAEEMNSQRKKLGLRWNEVATRAGMTAQNLLRIRNGEIAISELAAAGIDRALEWGTRVEHYHQTGELRPQSGDPERPHLRVVERIDEPAERQRGLLRRIIDVVLGAPPTDDLDFEPDLLDDAEHEIWAITDLTQRERWMYIQIHRAQGWSQTGE